MSISRATSRPTSSTPRRPATAPGPTRAITARRCSSASPTKTGFPHEGYVDFVDNQLNPEAGTIRIRAVFDNRDHAFTPGLFARIRLVGSGKYPATLVLDRAIGTDQDKKFVLILKPDSTVEYRSVQLGRLMDGMRVIRSGLKPGETIVTNGMQRAQPGMKVTPKLAEMAVDSAATDSAARR